MTEHKGYSLAARAVRVGDKLTGDFEGYTVTESKDSLALKDRYHQLIVATHGNGNTVHLYLPRVQRFTVVAGSDTVLADEELDSGQQDEAQREHEALNEIGDRPVDYDILQYAQTMGVRPRRDSATRTLLRKILTLKKANSCSGVDLRILDLIGDLTRVVEQHSHATRVKTASTVSVEVPWKPALGFAFSIGDEVTDHADARGTVVDFEYAPTARPWHTKVVVYWREEKIVAPMDPRYLRRVT